MRCCVKKGIVSEKDVDMNGCWSKTIQLEGNIVIGSVVFDRKLSQALIGKIEGLWEGVKAVVNPVRSVWLIDKPKGGVALKAPIELYYTDCGTADVGWVTIYGNKVINPDNLVAVELSEALLELCPSEYYVKKNVDDLLKGFGKI